MIVLQKHYIMIVLQKHYIIIVLQKHYIIIVLQKHYIIIVLQKHYIHSKCEPLLRLSAILFYVCTFQVGLLDIKCFKLNLNQSLTAQDNLLVLPEQSCMQMAAAVSCLANHSHFILGA
jgi:hypothetical protein